MTSEDLCSRNNEDLFNYVATYVDAQEVQIRKLITFSKLRDMIGCIPLLLVYFYNNQLHICNM